MVHANGVTQEGRSWEFLNQSRQTTTNVSLCSRFVTWLSWMMRVDPACAVISATRDHYWCVRAEYVPTNGNLLPSDLPEDVQPQTPDDVGSIFKVLSSLKWMWTTPLTSIRAGSDAKQVAFKAVGKKHTYMLWGGGGDKRASWVNFRVVFLDYIWVETFLCWETILKLTCNHTSRCKMEANVLYITVLDISSETASDHTPLQRDPLPGAWLGR